MKTSFASLASLTSFARPPHSLSLSSIALVSALGAAGCSVGNSASGGDPGIGYFVGELTNTPLAAGATSTTTSVGVSDNGLVGSVTSSNPSVVTVAPFSPAGSVSLSVTGGVPGSASLTAFDTSGNLLSTLNVTVAPTTTIQLDDTGPVTILTGQTFSEHSTTIGAGGVVLAGDGAIHYAYTGALSAGSASGCSGDCAYFQATSAGDGQVDFTASSSSATATFAVHAVDVSQVDSITLSPSSLTVSPDDAGSAGGLVTYTLSAGGAVVHGSGLQCQTANPNVANAAVDFLVGVSIRAATSGSIAVIGGGTPGSTTITCTLGTQQVVLPVTVQ